MTRPLKTGLDYFRHDTNASSDDKIELLEAAYGHTGYACYFKILERIYASGDGGINLATPEQQKVLAKRLNLHPKTMLKMVEKMVEIGLFLLDKWLENHYITSFRAEMETSEAVACRAQWRSKQAQKSSLSQGFSHKITPEITPEITDIVTKRNVTKRIITPIISPLKNKTPFGEFKNVLLTDREYQKLIDRFGEVLAKQWIETLSSGMASKPQKYKYTSHYAAILTWSRRDGQEVKGNGINRANRQANVPRTKDRTAELEAGWK